MIKKLRKHQISFKHAFDGIRYAVFTQPNFTVHLFFSFAAILSGILLQISPVEFAMIIAVIVFGLGTEMINTSIESVTDLVTTEWKKEAKIAKDVSAGTMLIAALGAVIVAGLIFIPKITEILFLK